MNNTRSAIGSMSLRGSVGLALVLIGALGCADGGAAGSCGETPCTDAVLPIRPQCVSNSDCPDGQGCVQATGRCAAERPPCTDRSQCGISEVCESGTCRLPTETPDAGPDASVLDASVLDASVLDAQVADAARDVSLPDARIVDVQVPDGARPDRPLLDSAMEDAAADDGTLDAAVAADLGAEPDAEPDVPPRPPGPAERGVYTYDRLPIGGIGELQRVAFHPVGEYALVLSRTGDVLVADWASGVATPFALPAGDPVYWTDVAFLPDGGHAVLTGYRFDREDGDTGIVAVFDDAAWRADEPPLTQAAAANTPGEQVTSVDVSPEGVPIVLLSRRVGGGYNAILRDFDVETEGWGDLLAATVTSAGCGGLAHVKDEFGGVGLLVTCGLNGADLQLYRTLGGVAEWVSRPGVGNIGNLGEVAAHPSLDYALIIGWSGRRVHRFEGGRLLPSNTAPNYTRIGINYVAFQQEGQRALITGRAGVQPIRGTVIEYRHDLYRCPDVDRDCDLTEVSIPGFNQPPYNADGNYRINHAGFRPGCDGGFLVGGFTSFQENIGFLIRFQIANGSACEVAP